jgi:hypothetical protein
MRPNQSDPGAIDVSLVQNARMRGAAPGAAGIAFGHGDGACVTVAASKNIIAHNTHRCMVKGRFVRGAESTRP